MWIEVEPVCFLVAQSTFGRAFFLTFFAVIHWKSLISFYYLVHRPKLIWKKCVTIYICITLARVLSLVIWIHITECCVKKQLMVNATTFRIRERHSFTLFYPIHIHLLSHFIFTFYHNVCCLFWSRWTISIDSFPHSLSTINYMCLLM